MNNNNRAIVFVIGAIATLFVFSLLLRFVFLSTYGFGYGWMYFGLPIGGIGLVVLLLRLGALNFGQKSGPTTGWPQFGGWQAPPPPAPIASPSASQRLSELDSLRANGAISEAEYNTRREAIISNV
jgi:hypothetical protein